MRKCENKGAAARLLICALILNSKPLDIDIFRGCTAQFVSELVGNSEKGLLWTQLNKYSVPVIVYVKLLSSLSTSVAVTVSTEVPENSIYHYNKVSDILNVWCKSVLNEFYE